MVAVQQFFLLAMDLSGIRGKSINLWLNNLSLHINNYIIDVKSVTGFFHYLSHFSFLCVFFQSVMTVFRNLSNIDKTVEKCRVSLNTSEDRLVFQMYCRHGKLSYVAHNFLSNLFLDFTIEIA